MLRHYDELGLLRPAFIDQLTDYRYYREDQLSVVWRITALRDMGFSLAEVAQLVEAYDDPERMGAALAERLSRLEAELEQTSRRITLVNTAQQRLGKEHDMSFDVTVKTIPARYAATLCMVISTYEDEDTAWGLLMRETAPLGLVEDDPCLTAATYLDDEYKESDIDVMVWKTVRGSYPDTEHVRFVTLPEVKVASCVVRGSYDQIGRAYCAVNSWVPANGYEFAGPMFNIYHVSPYESANPDEFVTEVCYPIR